MKKPQPKAYRVDRGGGWLNRDPSVLRGSYRPRLAPSGRHTDRGFRPALDVSPQPKGERR